MSDKPKISDEAVRVAGACLKRAAEAHGAFTTEHTMREWARKALRDAYPLLRQQWEAERNVPYGSDQVSVERDWLLAEAPDEVRERFFRARSGVPDA